MIFSTSLVQIRLPIPDVVLCLNLFRLPTADVFLCLVLFDIQYITDVFLLEFAWLSVYVTCPDSAPDC